GVEQIALGGEHSCARMAGGTVRCWGQNAAGQLGDGTTDDKLSPTPIPGLSVVEIALGGYHSCARLKDGSVYCWGENDHGQLGTGVVSPVPSLIPTLTLW
nr:chromosome condensation regulator RCC1 [Polyangiaceae bacterium]